MQRVWVIETLFNDSIINVIYSLSRDILQRKRWKFIIYINSIDVYTICND